VKVDDRAGHAMHSNRSGSTFAFLAFGKQPSLIYLLLEFKSARAAGFN